jgi:dipeptidyl aminopeptidase/acylaminoacyl peptidase
MKKVFTLFSLILCALCVKSQIPATEIYLLDIDNHGSHSHTGKPKNISNSKGYDSQPCFSNDGNTILFTSIRNGTQADIYEYQVVNDQVIQVTATPESEYSPTFMDDPSYFSTVRVEKDSAQRLWKFKINSKEKPVRILDKAVDSVGYHCWYGKEKLALFILTDPVTLQLAEVGKWQTHIEAEKVGRCMVNVTDGKGFYFVDKSDTLQYYISKYSKGGLQLDNGALQLGNNQTIEKLFPTVKGSEDFCITPEGNFIMAKESFIYLLNPATKSWIPLADLKAEGITGITRVAISTDGKRLAIVAKEME